jgi:hypothetical protein
VDTKSNQEMLVVVAAPPAALSGRGEQAHPLQGAFILNDTGG